MTLQKKIDNKKCLFYIFFIIIFSQKLSLKKVNLL